MNKYFFSVLISGIGIYYYYHFKSLNNSKLKIEEEEVIEDEEKIIEEEEKILEEELKEEELKEEELIEDKVIKEEVNNLDTSKLEENVTLNDIQRYQIILYKEPFTIFNNWEFIN